MTVSANRSLYFRVCGKEAPCIKADKRTLYVRRNVLNADDVITWATQHGFTSTLPADDMHVTIAFSKTPVDWYAAGDHFDSLKVDVTSGKVVPLGDKGAVVLKFSSVELTKRWQQFKDTGAVWDYDSYQPHVTISYQATDVDLSKVVPYANRLLLGPEIFEEVKEKWFDSVKETAKIDAGSKLIALVNKYSEDEPRDEQGRWTTGGAGGDSKSNADGVQAQTTTTPLSHAEAKATGDAVAKELGFAADKINYKNEEKYFDVDGKKYLYAGAAYPKGLGVDWGSKTGTVEIYLNAVTSAEQLHAIVAHEIEHILFGEVYQAWQEERKVRQ